MFSYRLVENVKTAQHGYLSKMVGSRYWASSSQSFKLGFEIYGLKVHDFFKNHIRIQIVKLHLVEIEPKLGSSCNLF